MTSALPVLSRALVRVLPQCWVARLLRYREAATFLLIASAASSSTAILFSILKWTVLEEHPVTAYVLAALVSAVFAYILCLAWSFTDIDRARGGNRAALFFATVSVAIALGALPLWISRHHLGLGKPEVSVLTETVSDFIASAVVGTFLSTWFLWRVVQRGLCVHTSHIDELAVLAPEDIDPPT
ncbi:MAG: GtrA family protein [Rhodococcus sp. (in: high G+C Gram-positive bacteria)]|uniref:GtrA family protein n=1 Tax=Rhodococcus sp. TaxID=1831 RepID=UPI002AD9C1ED|nr:GtrA family protein [Rhodococcus sp. (in: high G+C Gram-positive bacteria)]